MVPQGFQHLEFHRTMIPHGQRRETDPAIKLGETVRIEEADVNFGGAVAVVDAAAPRDARIEIARAEMMRALEPEINAAIVRELKAIGYRYVSLDLQGYRTGSLNEGLVLRPA